MIKFIGKGVCGGIAIGKISVFERGEVHVSRTEIADTAAEKKRYEAAKVIALEQLEELYQKVLDEAGEENAQIFEIHMMMLEDDDFNEAVINEIEESRVNAEYAVSVTEGSFAEMFSSMEDSYMQARAADVRDISNRLIKCLAQGSITLRQSDGEKMIICADDLAPSETVSFDKSKVIAFVTAGGSANSHTAILARNMNIPAVIRIGKDFLKNAKNGNVCIVDGYTGEVVINPDEETLKNAESGQRTDFEQKQILQSLKGKENITLDGTKVDIYANIGSTKDIDAVLANDAGGIGLFRSEFLYLESNNYPTEQQQFQAYKKVAQSMEGKKVVIRTLDIGADKQADYFGLDKEENPAMGLRAIRICLTRPQIFKTQLRALYRASAFGNIAIMFPMIISVDEVRVIKRNFGGLRGGKA